jgi:hypothetical protein
MKARPDQLDELSLVVAGVLQKLDGGTVASRGSHVCCDFGNLDQERPSRVGIARRMRRAIERNTPYFQTDVS